MKKQKHTQEINWIITIEFIVAVIIIALFLENGIVNNVNNKNMHKTSQVLLDQIIDVIEKNEKSEADMLSSLKDDYMIRVKAVSYMLDARPEAENDIKELRKIADLMSVDEIHLFDETGTIYGGTVPKYYHYSFDSGEQMAYFKPMLSDRTLTMCQDVIPNTSEQKKMMYVITWNEAGTKMVQVGIKPVRLLEELKQNEIATVVEKMPVYEGIAIYVADAGTKEIYGATDSKENGRTLEELGIYLEEGKNDKYTCRIAMQDGKKYDGIFQKLGDYAVGVRFAESFNSSSNLTAMVVVGVYLCLASIFILIMMLRLLRANQERDAQVVISNTDELTQCFNRWAYEEDLRRLPIDQPFVYISMDLNGLKKTNDTLGHVAGDELIRGAASCMEESFGGCGKIYRIGGDEFVAILTKQVQQHAQMEAAFADAVGAWHGTVVEAMTISSGVVSGEENAWTSWEEVAKAADARMYDQKAAYYKKKGGKR